MMALRSASRSPGTGGIAPCPSALGATPCRTAERIRASGKRLTPYERETSTGPTPPPAGR